jgi:hypothetical protein
MEANKHTMLRLLNSFTGLSDSYSIAELKQYLANEIKDEENARKEKDEEIIEKYNGVYLKKIDENSIFGQELELIYISKITSDSYTDRGNRTFELGGTRLSFSPMNVYKSEFKEGDVYSLFTEQELEEYEIITSEEYVEYEAKLKEFQNLIKSVNLKAD